MKLYVMRHGPAEDKAESGLDGDRALTASGRERVRAVAKLLADEDEKPVRILTSQLVRAVQTAEIVAVTTKATVETRREIAPGKNAHGLVQELAASGTKRAMIVGHEPDLSELVSSLTSGAFGRPFEKAMVVGLRVPGEAGRARVRFVLDPKALRLDADHRGADRD